MRKRAGHHISGIVAAAIYCVEARLRYSLNGIYDILLFDPVKLYILPSRYPQRGLELSRISIGYAVLFSYIIKDLPLPSRNWPSSRYADAYHVHPVFFTASLCAVKFKVDS